MISTTRHFQPTSNSINERFYNYLRVGYLLHITGTICLLLSIYILDYTLSTYTPTQPLALIFWSWLSSFFFMSALFSQLDALSRYQNFKQLRDQFYRFGFNNRIVKPMAKSRCQRIASILAASYVGNEEETKSYFKNLGYRWYHYLPDFFWQNPLFVFHPYFWKTTFFVKRYRSKYFV